MRTDYREHPSFVRAGCEHGETRRTRRALVNLKFFAVFAVKSLCTRCSKILGSLLVSLIFYSTTFSQSNPLFNYIPEDATTVFHIDMNRLKGRIPREVLVQSPLYKMFSKEIELPFLANPDASGLDLSAGILVAISEIEKVLPGDKRGSKLAVFFKLKNAESFTTSIRKLADSEERQIAVYGTDRLIISQDKIAAAWNNDVFVIQSGSDQDMGWSITDDTTAMSYMTWRKKEEIFFRGRRNDLFGLLTPKPGNKISQDSNFISLMHTDGDIHVFHDQSRMTVPALPNGAAMLLKKLQQVGTQKSTAIINFENGKIVMRAKEFPAPLVAELYSQFKTSVQNGELMRKLPPEKLVAMLSVSLDPVSVKSLLNAAGLKSAWDSLKRKMPVKIDPEQLAGAFKTNMLIAVLKNDKEPTGTRLKKLGGFEFLLALPIADKTKFNLLKNQIMPLIDSMKTGEKTSFKDMPSITFNEELLVLALDPSTARSFLYNPAPGEAPAWLHEFSQYPVVMNIHLRKLLHFFIKGEEKDLTRKDADVVKSFDQLYFYGGNYNNGAIEMNMEFRFSDKEQNSLKQLFDLLNKK